MKRLSRLMNLPASLIVIPLFLFFSCNRPATNPASQPTGTPAGWDTRRGEASAPRMVDLAPGLRIDYRVPQVEIDGEIILSEGALELFAYAKAPTPKEHESIVLVRTAPESIYRALGLIGLTPGAPARYIPATKTIQPATGDPVDVLVRYARNTRRGERNGKQVEESACDWMHDVARNRPMAKTSWLFTGSQRDADGRLTADFEGTVVTVVDFPSALLSLPTPHTDSDADLWLKAETSAIPPKGTPVTLILRPALLTSP